MDNTSSDNPIALQKIPQFVGRTTNWLYDHLRVVPRYNPLIICNRLSNRDEFPELQALCPHWSLARRILRRLKLPYSYPREVMKLTRLRPRFLHSHFGSLAARDLKLAKALDTPWIVSFYGGDVYQGTQEVLQERYSLLFQKATRVLALGPVMKARLVQLGCSAEKVNIHPLGVALEKLPFRPRVHKLGEPLRILFAGTFREKKGIQYLVEAAALLTRAGVPFKLQLVGDETEKPGDSDTKAYILQRIRCLGLEDIVSYSSFLTFEKLVALALRTHVFVAPSVTARDGDSEGTPFVIQQMMATGMPVIATTHSDIPYIFGEHSHLLVPERNAKAIADRLQQYAEDPDSLVCDGAKLRDRIRDYDVRKCAARLSGIYDEI